MRKRILLIGGNFFPELTGIGKYNGEMIQWFASKGYECTVIATSPYYPQWKVQQPYSNKWYSRETIPTSGKPIEVYRCPHYVPSRPSGSKRLLSEMTFTISSLFALVRVLSGQSFDYVITVAPPFQLGFHALLYKTFHKAKFLYHIQDLQIEAARDLNMIKSKKLVDLLFLLEKRVLKKSDMVSSISGGMLKKIKDKIGRDVTLFPNWVDTEFFHPLKEKEDIKESFGFSPSQKIILYSGAIGEKQGLEMILSTAKALEQESELQFVICGSGPYKERLHQMAIDQGLANVHFLPLQSHKRFNEFLNMADVHLVIQKASAGDLVMPSKLSTILAVGGLAVVTAAPGTSLYETVHNHGIGLVVEPESPEMFTAAVLNAVRSDGSLLCSRARRYAEDALSRDQILTRYAEQMEQLHEPGVKKKKRFTRRFSVSDTIPESL
ncbi:WcaI family glycosyltransferase [Paraflavisolibacter sp. H34]|uniref:WcaI family glycosyltransferase n=1 Tax=Huijunlia imazamoxiresistens TaxID=3127457 RepID=UPI0030195538